MYIQHPLRSQQLARMLQMKKNFSSHKQMLKTTSMNRPLNGKKQSRKKAKERVANEEPSSIKSSVKAFTKIDEHYVELHERNRGNLMNTSKTRYRSTSQEFKV